MERFLGSLTRNQDNNPVYLECDCGAELLQIWIEEDVVYLSCFGGNGKVVEATTLKKLLYAASSRVLSGEPALIHCTDKSKWFLAFIPSDVTPDWAIGLYRKTLFGTKCIWEIVSNHDNLLKIQKLMKSEEDKVFGDLE